MKPSAFLLAAAVLLAACFCGCTPGGEPGQSAAPFEETGVEETSPKQEKEMKKIFNVIFIGNSYTYYNDLPSLFAAVCAERGISVQTELIAAGGYTLAHFVSESNEYGIKLREKLAKTAYDYAVIQEQSVRPAESPKTFYNSLGELLELIRANGATPVLYETWGRADGSDTLLSRGWTHEDMQEKLYAAYKHAAEEYGTLLALAGERFHEAYRKGEEVFAPDGSHPSPVGSRIAAEAICEAIFGTAS